MKRYIVLIIAVLLVQIDKLQAQVVFNLDELDKEIIDLPDDEKIDVYLNCYGYFVTQDLSKAVEFNKKAYELLKEGSDSLKLAVSLYNFGYVNRKQANYNKAISYFEECIKIFYILNNNIGLSECYNNVGSLQLAQNKLQKALSSYTRAYTLADEVNYQKGIVNNINNIGKVYTKQGHYDKAIYFYEKSLKLSGRHDYSVYNNLGAVYKEKHDLSKALKYFKKSLSLAQKSNKLYDMVVPLGNIGVIYQEQGEYDKALGCYKKSQEIEEKLQLKSDLIATYTNIGNVFRLEEKQDSAIYYFSKAIALAEQSSAKGALQQIYTSIALTYEATGAYTETIKYQRKINQLNKELFDIEKNAQLEEMLAKYESEVKEKELAILKKDQALKEIELKKNKAQLGQQILEQKLSATQHKAKMTDMKKKNELQELILDKTKTEKEKKERELVLLTKEKELEKLKFEKEQAELKQRNTRQNFAMFFAGVLILAALIIIILYRQKLKTADLLWAKTEEVNRQKIYKLMSEQELQVLNANLEGQEKERKRIAQELHDGIGGNLASIKLNLANITERSGGNLKEVIESVDKTYKEVREISHNLLPSTLYQSTFIRLINNYIQDILTKKNIAVNFTAFPEEQLNILSDEIKVELYRIVQELISNIVKHSQATSVDIQLNLRDDFVNLMVEDNGIGFQTNRPHIGIGLTNIKSRVKNLKGEVSIDSAPNLWSLINIEIPASF